MTEEETAEGCSYLTDYLQVPLPLDRTCEPYEVVCKHYLLALKTEVDEVMWDIQYTMNHIAINHSEYRSWTPEELDSEFDRQMGYLVRMRLLRTRMWDRPIDWKDVTLDLELNSPRHIAARIIMECEYRLYLMGKVEVDKSKLSASHNRLDKLARRADALASWR